MEWYQLELEADKWEELQEVLRDLENSK